MKPNYKGNKCDACHKLVWHNPSWRSEQSLRFKKRGEMYGVVFPLLNGEGDVLDTKHTNYLNKIRRTHDQHLTGYGKKMREQVKHLIQWRDNSVPKNLITSNSFLSNAVWLTQNHPQYEELIEVDILNHSIHKMKGHRAGAKLHLKEATRSLLCTIRSESSVACRRLSENLNNISERNMRKHASALDGVIRAGTGGSIIDRTDEEAIELVKKFVRGEYEKQKLDHAKPLAISLSTDATNVAFGMEVHQATQKLVGGSFPNHAIPLPERGDDLLNLIDCFKDKDNKQYLPAAEIKVCSMVVQSCAVGHSPMFHLLAQPQTKNMNSEFNERCVQKIILPAFEFCQEEGMNAIFLGLAVDGVSCDSKFVKTKFLGFLLGLHDYFASTDCNHNLKNERYQAAIGGLVVKTIGAVLLDAGMFKASGIKQGLYIIKDWASDGLVLQFFSADTVSKILHLKGPQDERSRAVTLLNLFFHRAHLAAVNMKDVINPEDRVTMIWYAFIWSLHIDGMSITTKRNLCSECISMAFMMMLNEVGDPHLITTEPSEHSNTMLRGMQREFTVLGAMTLFQKLLRKWYAIIRGGLRLSRKTLGYGATLGSTVSIYPRNRKYGPVTVKRSDLRASVSSQVWKELKPILLKASSNMKKLLRNICCVEEMHPLLKKFDADTSLQDLHDFCSEIYNKTDKQLFKKEGEVAEPTVEQNGESINETSAEVESFTNDALALERERLIRLIQNDGESSSERERDIDNDSPLPSEVAERIHHFASDCLEDNLVEDDETKKVFDYFCDVVTTRDYRTLAEKSNNNILLTAMKSMFMRTRERGNNGSCRFMTLTQQFFKKEDYGLTRTQKQKDGVFLKRGSVVKLKDREGHLLIFEIWKKSGNKLFPCPDDLEWPIVDKILNGKSHRIGLKKIVLQGDTFKYLE